MAKIFTGDIKQDSKMFGNIFNLKGIGEEGIDIRGKFTDIDHEGYYVFRITSQNTDIEEYLTRAPNAGEIIQ